MGRSKFPGKPPKTVTRKRIKVLGRPEGSQNDTVTAAAAADNIYYGLSLFNETFGDNEKGHPPFHGFSTNEANLSVCYVRTQQRDASEKAPEQAKKLLSTHGDTDKDSGDANDLLGASSGCREVRNSSNTTHDHRLRLDPSRGAWKEAAGETLQSMKPPVLKSVNNILERHHRTRQLRNSTAKRLLQRAKSSISSMTRNSIVPPGDKCGSVRKFVLPVRSAHSSRVIKPNKRFIEELEETAIPENVEISIEKQKRIKVDASDRDCRRSRKNIDGAKGTSQFGTDVEKMSTTSHGATAKLESKKLLNSGAKHKVLSQSATCNLAVSQNSLNITRNRDGGLLTKLSVLSDLHQTNSESSRVQTRSGSVNCNGNIRFDQDASKTNETVFADSHFGESRNVELVTIEGKISSSGDVSVNPDNLDTESTLSETASENGDNSEDEQSEWTGRKLNGGKVILRKARLKLDNNKSGGTEGPFSNSNAQSNSSSGSNPALLTTVKCGVCGAVRFYRFVKQARKFGIHSCESCRKFISKMIKRQACAKSTNNALPVLQCHKGDGLCLVPPVVRSQQWNLMRCVYKARCPACWLKMCLKCYNIPAALRSGLNAMLPLVMRDPVTTSIALGSASLLCQDENDGQLQRLTGCKLNWPEKNGTEQTLFKSATSWNGLDMLGYKAARQNATTGILGKKLEKFDYPMSISPSKKRRKDSRIKVRKKLKSPIVVTPPIEQNSQLGPRQRLELKGPRVKHVCRSASVALGQPMAMFPTVESGGKEEGVESGKNITKAATDEDKSEMRDYASSKETESKVTHVDSVASLGNNGNVHQQNQQRRGKFSNQQSLTTLNYSGIRSLPKGTTNAVHTVSIDFWEQYDPAEVGAKGFALISSESFHIPAICYLCGSAGKDPLIHCQCCCEPYHAFCLEPSEWNACVQSNWCCPRCTVCQTCRLRSGPKLSCIRCRQSFHHSCLSKSGVSARIYSPDRPYICQSCIKCKSCGSEGVSVHVGNLPLCSMCFKLRQRGNYCPLCQRCYDDNDFDTKMMECNECSCWVHARCEGLSDERYEILSYLPDSIEFTCRQCSPDPNSLWRNAVEAALKAGFNAVIKSLSKNRKACAVLKWNPRNEGQCRPASSARKLDFSDEKLNFVHNEGRFDAYDDFTGERWLDDSNPRSDNSSKSDFEFDFDQSSEQPRRGLRRARGPQKLPSKELVAKTKSSTDLENRGSEKECLCFEQQLVARPLSTLLSVKRKVNGNEYGSLLQFHCDMEHVINRASNPDLDEAYRRTLHDVFPWFDPEHSKNTAENDPLSTPTKETRLKDVESAFNLDDLILESRKEETLRGSSYVPAKLASLYRLDELCEDRRMCSFCKSFADGRSTREGRLLYCGQNEWVHANCALWSNEVYEEIDGSLQNVHSAVSRGRLIRCTKCGKKGASVGCCSKNCSSTYHYPCARDVGLAFNDDKTVYCAQHSSHCADKTPQREADFDLKRPVYVELDRKKKKYVEPASVKVMIGSLLVDCLGTVVPEYSDCADRIVPSDYKCSRLYWSTVNPLKIVRYHVRTFVQVYVPEATPDLENNVTTDHSVEMEKERKKTNSVPYEELVVKRTLDVLVDSVCNKEADENLAEQNNTDLLPPELKEAIFEDLPHDLLDGISMQDIFPKMTYEDFLAMDLKNDGVFGTDLLKDEILPSDVDEIIKPVDTRPKMDPSMPELGSQTDPWLQNSVQDIVDDLVNSKNQKLCGRELKRSKSEVMTNNSLVVVGATATAPPRHHQRSCSLTWSCKLDGTYGPTTKRRKLPRNTNSPRSDGLALVETQNRIPEGLMESKEHKRLLWHARQQPRILQVDGALDPTSSSSECGSPEYTTEERIPPLHDDRPVRIPQVDGANDDSTSDSGDPFRETGRNHLHRYAPRFSKLNRLSQQTASTGSDGASDADSLSLDEDDSPGSSSFKIPQLDGADDVSSDDDCQSHGDETVTCTRCRCTYRTQDSYNRHLATCDVMTTSDSDSETMDKLASPRMSTSPEFMLVSPSEGHTLCSEYSDAHVVSPIEASVPSTHSGVQIEPVTRAIIAPQIHATHATVETVHRTVLTSNDVIVQTQYTRTTTTLPNPTVLSHQPESTVQITEITDPSPICNAINDPVEYSHGVPTPQASPVFSTTGVQTATDDSSMRQKLQHAAKTKPRSPRTPKSRAKGIKPNILRPTTQPQQGQVRFHAIHNNAPIIQLQQQTQRPTVILQQVAQPNLMSTYVETLQQQANQNHLQYVATIGQNDNTYKPQFITANSLVPGTTYIQAPDNLLALQNAGISVLPGVQIAQPQPTVLGTIIQQQPAAIQCGVISSEQLVLSSAPALEMFTDSTGSMFVTSQPMYYGLETIVSNTVMSSSQFVAGTVPQVLASSYQTTTQVFQASKLVEPIVDVQSVSGVQNVQNMPANYVVVNQPPIPVQEPVVAPAHVAIQRQEPQHFVAETCPPVSCMPHVDLAVQQVQNILPEATLSQTTIPRVAVRPSPVSHPTVVQQQAAWKSSEPIFNSEQINNCVRPYFDSKHVSENTSMIKSSLCSSKMAPLTTRDSMSHHNENNVVPTGFPSVSNGCNNNVVNVAASSFHNVNANPNQVNKLSMPVINNHTPTSRPMNRVLPMQAVTPKPEPMKPVEKILDVVIDEPTKPTDVQYEPTVKDSKMGTAAVVVPEKSVDASVDTDVTNEIKINVESVEKAKDNFKIHLDDETLGNKSLKIIIQKQLQDGSYKITQNIEPLPRKNLPQITSVEVLNPKHTPRIASLQLMPSKNVGSKNTRIEDRNKHDAQAIQMKPKAPPIAVKKPRIVSKDSAKAKRIAQKSTPKRSGLMYEVKSQDGFTHTASSMSEVWEKVYEAVQTARKAHNLPPLPHNPLMENLGLENNATVYLIEQLPGVNRCTKYKPRLHDLAPLKPGELENDLLAECESGTARAEPFKRRKVHDMFSWLASRHRQQPKMIAISENESRRAASTNLPMAMRFRILKETSKESVGVYHSHIHGRGLFCLRDIEAGEMVIEYAGEVIRASLTDKREKYYDSKNIGCYMFKIDDHLVVDATMKGNAARFINHSCEPNCYSRVVDILGKKHILIFALRRIIQGEELTYDYKFPFEDIKIPCTCGSRRCRKYLN